MKINIASPGRFHVMDLARELDSLGYDVRFYSFVPDKRAVKFGLRKECNVSLFLLMSPFLAIAKFTKSLFFRQLSVRVQDFLTGILMRRCDVFIAMSGNYVYSLKRAKKKGATIILERGSKHILDQKRILESIPSLKGKTPVPDMNVRRELAGYEIADYISIASEHVKRSFIERGYPADKLFVNPYGVDLSMFYCNSTIEKKYDVLMVGGWSYQKGCDLIIEAIKNTDYTFLHVGSLVDLDFPEDKQFTHVPAVEQFRLVEYYNQAKVFILPSRQDGFGMVLSQAVACNLPIIGSKDTGAEDLMKFVESPDNITIIRDYTPESLIEAINTALEKYKKLGEKSYAGTAKEQLSWGKYGERYGKFLGDIKHNLAMGGVILNNPFFAYKPYDIIMVGGWSYRKGCDMLTEVLEETDYKFLHVGGIVDMEFPNNSRFKYIPPVDQTQLVKYYNMAKIFVLPSREEGMSLVQMQAIRCGLPIVCSQHTGGKDIATVTGMNTWVFEMKEYTKESLKEEIKKALCFAERCNPNDLCLDNLSWSAYGKRYADFLKQL